MKTVDLRIAKSTLRMTPNTARMISGMDYRDAYRLVFRTDLDARLAQLVEEYGDCVNLSWELDKYGWTTPQELQAALCHGRG